MPRSKWTVESLKEYVDMRFGLNDRALNAALSAAEKANEKAETAAEKRFDGQNEFREQLRDQAADLMPKREAEIRISQLDERLIDLTNRFNKGEGHEAGKQAAINATRALLVSIGTLVLATAGIIVAIIF